MWKRHRRFSADGTWDRIHARLLAEADAAGEIDWTVSVDSTINRAHQHGTNLSRVERPRSPAGPQGAGRITGICATEPPDHAIGRSRGGLSTKIHQLVDGNGRPLVIAADRRARAATRRCCRPAGAFASPRRARPAPHPARRGAGRQGLLLPREPWTAARPRDQGRDPEPSDQIGHRKRRGSDGGRPPAFDAEAYKGRNVVERSFNDLKQWRGLATRYDKLAITYRGGVVLRAIIIWLRAIRRHALVECA